MFVGAGEGKTNIPNETQNLVFRNPIVPFNRVKRIMKLDDSVEMVAPETPVLLAEATGMFIKDLTERGWKQIEESIHPFEDKNIARNLKRKHIVKAAKQCDLFDFLIDIIPSEEEQKNKDTTEPMRISCDPKLLQQHQEYMSKIGGTQRFMQQVRKRRKKYKQPVTNETHGNSSTANTQTGSSTQLIQTTPCVQRNEITQYVPFHFPPNRLNYVDRFQPAENTQISLHTMVPILNQQDLTRPMQELIPPIQTSTTSTQVPIIPLNEPMPGLSSGIRETTFEDMNFDDFFIHEQTPGLTSMIYDHDSTTDTDLDDIHNWLQERCSSN